MGQISHITLGNGPIGRRGGSAECRMCGVAREECACAQRMDGLEDGTESLIQREVGKKTTNLYPTKPAAYFTTELDFHGCRNRLGDLS